MKDGTTAYKLTSILGNEEDSYFKKASKMCEEMSWEVQQFRNHKSKQENKNKFTYKGFKIEIIVIQ